MDSTAALERSRSLATLLLRAHGATADFIVDLATFDRDRHWIPLGYSSLFTYLHRELGLSRGAAHYRRVAAALVQRHPEVVEPLRDGRLCLSSVVELARVITPENAAEVLPKFFRLSRREAQEVAVAIDPLTVPQRVVVTTLPDGRAHPPPAAAGAPPEVAPLAGTTGVQPVEPPNAPEPPAAPSEGPPAGEQPHAAQIPRPAITTDSVQPLTAELRRLHLTVSRGFLDKLEKARDALSHARPGADLGSILEAGLDLILEKQAKRRGLVAKPRPATTPTTGDAIPAHVRRAVWKRDGGKCQWPLHHDGICGSPHRAELDHVIPRARGGPTTVENLRVLCRTHNQIAARLAFGDAWIDRSVAKRRAAARARRTTARRATKAARRRARGHSG